MATSYDPYLGLFACDGNEPQALWVMILANQRHFPQNTMGTSCDLYFPGYAGQGIV